MKALLINGSPRTNGCTFTVLTELKNTLEKEGIDAEIIHVGHKDIHGCTAYRKCAQTGKCVFDDIVNEVAPKFAEADAFVIGAPVYYASTVGGAISFLDRLFFSTSKIDKIMKVGAAVVTCRRGGNTASFDVLNKYLSISSMSIASSQYWNMVYGGQAEEVLLDTEGLQTIRTLGRNIAFMVKSFAPGKKTDFECHQMEHRLGAYTNCNHGAGLAVLPPVLLQTHLQGRKSPIRIFQNILVLLVLVSLIGAMTSGVIISRHLFSFLNFKYSATASRIHMLSVYRGFVFISMHLGLHFNIFSLMIKSNPKKPIKAVVKIVLALIFAYGVFAFFKRNLIGYLFLQNQFFMLGDNELLLLYMAVMFAISLLSHCISTLIRKSHFSKVQQ